MLKSQTDVIIQKCRSKASLDSYAEKVGFPTNIYSSHFIITTNTYKNESRTWDDVLRPSFLCKQDTHYPKDSDCSQHQFHSGHWRFLQSYMCVNKKLGKRFSFLKMYWFFLFLCANQYNNVCVSQKARSPCCLFEIDSIDMIDTTWK